VKELTEIRFNENRILLEDNLVKSPILPRVTSELDRDVAIKANCRVEGAVYARNLEVQDGPFRVSGAVFTQVELHVNTDATGPIIFERSVGSADAVVSHAQGCQLQFLADINAKQVRLRNAYIAASVFADEIVLDDCVVIGGAFATRSLELNNCVVGTFNSPTVRVSKSLFMLLPSAFSVEPVAPLPGTECWNLALADLGALMRGAPESPQSGKINLDLQRDEQRTVLADGATQQVLRSYSVAGKVLAADLLDLDSLQNHFLLSAAGLSVQLLQTYDLGLGVDGNAVELTPDRISAFFFDILQGKIAVRTLDVRFSLMQIADNLPPETLVAQ
jgi:hypothetical protein